GFGQNFILLLAALAVVGGLIYGGTVEPHIPAWFKRNILLQSASYPQNTYLEILRAENGKIRIPKGDDYTLEVVVKPESKEIPDRVFVEFYDRRAPLAMKRRDTSDDPNA